MLAKLPAVPSVPLHELADDELLDLSARLGACKFIAERRFLALLPEIERRRLYRKAPLENKYLLPDTQW